MTLKEIKKHYRVRKMDGYYDLSTIDVQTSGRSVYKYLCTIYKVKTNKFHIKGHKPTSKINELVGQINNYLNNLEYDSSYYCPSYCKGTGQDWLMYDLLRKYGFVRHGNDFRYNKNSIYGAITTNILLNYSVNTDTETVHITMYHDNGTWSQFKSDFNFKNIHNTLDGILKPLFLVEGVSNIQTSDKMVSNDIDVVISSLKGLDVTTNKLDLKNKLLELANSL